MFAFGNAPLVAASEYRVFCGSLPVVNYMGKDRKPKGIAVDILIEIMEKAGHPLDPSDFKCSDWKVAMARVAKNPMAILISAALTPEREFHYSWVGPVAQARIGLIGRKSASIEVLGPSSLAGLRIAVIRDSAPVSMLRALCPQCDDTNIVAVDSDTEQFTLLRDGEVDLIGQSDISAPLLMQAHGLDPDEYEMVRVLTTMKLYILLNRHADPDLLAGMRRALDDMSQEHLREIRERHMGTRRLSVRRD